MNSARVEPGGEGGRQVLLAEELEDITQPLDRGQSRPGFDLADLDQALLASHTAELFYWAREVRGSSAEVDYLAIRNGRIAPVEVKSGRGGSLRSLHLMLDTYPTARKAWSSTREPMPAFRNGG